MTRKTTKRKVWIPLPPRGLRPRLDNAQVRDLDLVNLVNLDTIANGRGDEEVLWQYVAGCYTWSKVAELMGIGIDEMADELSVAASVLDRFRRTGRVIFSGPEYQRAKLGVEVMRELAATVDRPTAIAAAEYSEARINALAAAKSRAQEAAA